MDILRNRIAEFFVIDEQDLIIQMPHRQPVPLTTMVVSEPKGRYTSIMRVWEPGDVERCRLCPKGRCQAENNACLLCVPGRIADEDAQLFDSTGLAWPRKAAR